MNSKKVLKNIPEQNAFFGAQSRTFEENMRKDIFFV